MVRHHVREVVATPCLQIHITDRVGEIAGCSDVLAGELETIGRRLDPRRQQQRTRPIPDVGGISGGIESRENPQCATTVAEHDPCPAETVDDPEPQQRIVNRAVASAASMLARSILAKARCSAWRLLRTPSVDSSAASANHAACAASAFSVRPRRSSPRPRTRGCCRATDTERSSRRFRRRRSPANGWRGDPRRRSPLRRARRAHRARTRQLVAVRRRRMWQAPTGHVDRRGTTARSSTGSSISSARRRSGLRLVGSLKTLNRSSSRRVISSIDSVFVRAAASSIASGRPSSDRHSSSTASSTPLTC